MRYSRMREWLARTNRDMRNPYGSRGGYVRSDRRGRDYEYDRMGDMARDRRYDRMGNDMEYNQSDRTMGGNGNQSDMRYGRDYANYDMNDYYPVRRSGYFDYETYDHESGYDMARGRDRNYDMRSGRDYASEDYKLTPSEIRKWDKELKRESGSNFTADQIRQIAQQQGIRFDEFSPELLTAITNMMYSDYHDTVRGDITMYVKLAKDFLCDEDFDGTPEEKAYLYYTAIVDKD